MKLTTIVLFVLCLQVSTAAFGQGITLSVKNVPLKTVLKKIREQTSYNFVFNERLTEGITVKNLQVNKSSVEEVLKQCLKDQPLTFSVIDHTVIIKPVTAAGKPASADEVAALSPAFSGEVKGKVLDEKGEPVPGVSVSVKGTSNGTATDASGSFVLNGVSPDATLAFTSVNMNYTEVKVASQTTLVITLKPNITALTAIVVTANTGYQTISKERSTGSFAKPDMEVVKARSGTMNLLQRLDGQIPGLSLNNGTNSSYYPVMLRGITSISGATQPLYVVDGIPVDDLNAVNPNDVADITVLKDATAASIWGARAANGVIVVTTKKGSKNQDKLRVDYDVFYSFQGKPDINTFPRMNSAQYLQTMQELYNMPGYVRGGATDWKTITAPDQTRGTSPVLPHEYLLYGQTAWMPAFYQHKTLEEMATVNNLQQMKDNWYRNAMLNNHTVAINGSAGKYGVYASLSYTDNKNPTPGEKNNTYQINARQDYSFNKNLQVYLITNIAYNTTAARRSISPDSRFVPYASFLDANGQPQDMSWININDSLRNAYEQKSTGLPDIGQLNLSYNPSDNFHSGYTNANNQNNRLLAGVTLKLYDGLRFEGTYGGVLVNNQSKSFDAVTGYDGQLEIGKMTVTSPALKSFVPTTGGTYLTNNVQQKNWTVRNQLVYDNSWQNNRHQLTALAGTEIQQQIATGITAKVRGYDENLLTHKAIDYPSTGSGISNTIINTAATYKINDAFSEYYADTRFRSYYANAAYTFLRKYTINASTRFDQSNLFGTDVAAQAKPVWAVGGSWMMNREAFAADIKWLDRLQLRATYGITGNSPVPGSGGSYDILERGMAVGVPAGSVNTLQITTPGNSHISWEQTQNINVGVDFGVFNNRITGSVDYYRKHTTGLLGDVPQNPFTGYTSIYGNAGVINNAGIELRLNTINIDQKDFTWSTQLTLAHNKGKVVTLYTETPYVYASSLLRLLLPVYYKPQMIGLIQGYQPFSLLAYRYAGLDAVGDPQIKLADGTVTKTPGIAKVTDLVNMGSTQPLVSGGFSNNFRYKRFNLGVNMVYNFAFVLRRDVNDFFTGRMMTRNYISGNLHEDFQYRWKQAGDEAFTNIPAYDPAADRASRTDLNYYTAADINVIKGDYIKLRDITLAYDMPAGIVNRIRASAITFRVQMNNIMLWKANKYDIDPEFYSGMGVINSNTASGYVNGMRNVPFNQHSFTIGAHVTF